MNDKARLEASYRRLLKEHGLDGLTHSGALRRESHHAMEMAGWLDYVTPELEAEYERQRNSCDHDIASLYATILNGLGKEVEESIKSSGGKLDYDVFVGGLPLGETNACVQILDAGALILINHGLLQLIYQIGKVFILSYDWLCGYESETGDVLLTEVRQNGPDTVSLSSTLGWPSVGWTRKATIEAMAAIVLAYRRHGSVTKSPRQPLPTEARAATLAKLVHDAEKFVVAHEYAHILRGHLNGERAVLKTPFGEIDAVLQPEQQDELEADELATTLVLAPIDWHEPHGPFHANCAIAGIALMLLSSVFAAMAFQGAEAVSLKTDSHTHPSSNVRLVRILDNIHRRRGKSTTEMARICAGWVLNIMGDVVTATA